MPHGGVGSAVSGPAGHMETLFVVPRALTSHSGSAMWSIATATRRRRA